MPFKSEAQRRYLWANEPEIARDWTDTYGSKIHAADGGIMRIPFAEGSNWAAEQVLNKKKQELQNLKNLRSEQQGMNMDTAEIDKAIQSLETFVEEGIQDEKGIGSKLLEFIFGSAAEGSELTFQERDKLIEEANAMGDGSEISSNRPYGIDSAMIDTGKAEEAINYNRQQNAMQKMMNQEYGIGNLPNDFNKNYKFSAENWRNKLGNMKGNIGRGVTNAMSALAGFPGFGLVKQAFRGQQLTPEQKLMNNQFFQNYNVGIGTQQNPFQMTSGPFQGMNAPGMSAFGSATSQDMAQKWLERYGAVDHYSDAMKQKKQTMIDLVGSGQQDVSAPNYPGNNQGSVDNSGMNQGSISSSGHKAPGGSGYGPHKSSSGNPFNYRRGGIANLWPR